MDTEAKFWKGSAIGLLPLALMVAIITIAEVFFKQGPAVFGTMMIFGSFYALGRPSTSKGD